jgi:hypothetical protein
VSLLIYGGQADAWIISMNNKIKLVYSTGMHGNFIGHLFYCYEKKEMVQLEFNKNGNSHNRERHVNIYDLSYHNARYTQEQGDKLYGIVYNGTNEFYYGLRRSFDAAGGAGLRDSGIELLEKDVWQFIKAREVHLNFVDDAMGMYGLDMQVSKSRPVPRNILRNYILLNLITYMKHSIWKSNEQIKKMTDKILYLHEVLDYKKLKQKLDKFFDTSLDFENLHRTFISVNGTVDAHKIESDILSAVKQRKEMDIPQLDVVSEANILYKLERENFDIPFLLSNSFYTNTAEIIEYIDHFPSYLKRPNRLFEKLHKFYAPGDK